jgi:flagellar biosynthetic protein FliQ
MSGDVADFIIQLTNEGILLTIVLSLPGILVSLFIGLIVAIFSATTQIQEQTLSFVPKMIAVFAVLAATAPWVGATMIRFAAKCMNGFVEVVN